MGNFNWDRFWSTYLSSYFAPLFMLAIGATLAIYAFTRKKPTRITILLGFYAMASALQTAFAAFGYLYTPLYNNDYISSFSISLFMAIEIIATYLLITSVPIPNLQKRILQFLLITYLVVATIYSIENYYCGWYTGKLSMVELPIILFFCSIYYYNLITQPARFALLRQAQFWAVGGMTFTALVLLPFSLVSDNIAHYRQLNYLLDIIPPFCYTIVFIIHYKAIKCSQQIQP